MSTGLAPPTSRHPAGPDPSPNVVGRGASAEWAGGDWPHTARVLPWCLAGFVAMLWLVPFDAASLPINVPFDARLDRVVLMAIVTAILGCMVARPALRPRLAVHGVDLLVFIWAAICVVSVLHNLDVLARTDEFDFAVKKLFLLFAFIGFFYVVRTIVRPRELRYAGFFLVGLACLTALGTIYEYRTGANVFYDWSGKLPLLRVGEQPPDPLFGRELISGPTSHAIALATMLAMALPFAVVGTMRRDFSSNVRLLHGVAVFLILAACFATIRKTGAVAPAIALFVVFMYRPREALQLLPFGLVLVLVINFAVAPGAVIRVKAQLVSLNESSSTQGRTVDYEAVKPDILTRPVLGRGQGTYDASRYRYLDNEYLQRVIETGFVGLLGFVAMLVALLTLAHRAARDHDPDRSAVGIAAVAGIAAWAAAAAFFDILSFEQAPYMLFLVAGLAAVAARPRRVGQPGLP